MLSCVYGSSEYAQGFSRIGAMFGSIFIVNGDVRIENVSFDNDGKFESVTINLNDTPVNISKGLIVGPDYHDFVHGKIKSEKIVKQTIKCARVHVVTSQPFIKEGKNNNNVATFVYPPGEFNTTNPIRIIQYNYQVAACPRDLYLIMISMQLDDQSNTEPLKAML